MNRQLKGVVLVGAVAVLASGCMGGDSVMRRGEVSCLKDTRGAKVVVIQVHIDGTRHHPRITGVDQSTCRVDEGTIVRWVGTGPHGSALDAIVFKGTGTADRESASNDRRMQLPARGNSGRRVIEMTARPVERQQRFDYAIHAGEFVLDPDIIIDPVVR